MTHDSDHFSTGAREYAALRPDYPDALHWFDLDRFYAEVRRVLQPGGVLAAWSYGLILIDPAVDAAVRTFYEERVGRYWPPERRHVDTHGAPHRSLAHRAACGAPPVNAARRPGWR